MENISENKTLNIKRLPNILIVDDTPANVLLLVRMLAERGYNPQAVLSGKLALEAVRTELPDLILLDINMPEMNGYEVCGQLKADALMKDIPVIFISALSETIDKVKAFSVGGVDYVTKPFQFEEVEARVKTHLKLSRLQIETERQNRQLHENYDHLKKIEDLHNKLTQTLVHDMREPLIAIAGYLETLETDAEKKLNSNELETLRNARTSGLVLLGMINSLLDVSVVLNRNRSSET